MREKLSFTNYGVNLTEISWKYSPRTPIRGVNGSASPTQTWNSERKCPALSRPELRFGAQMVQRLRRKHEIRIANGLSYLAPNSDSGRKWFSVSDANMKFGAQTASVSDAQNAKSGFLALLQTFLGRFYV